MPRIVCPTCQKPPVSCYCSFVTPVDNAIELIIWQHPSEVNHPKGSVALLSACLSKVQLIIGEQFTFEEFKQHCNRENIKPLLLSPLTTLDIKKSDANVFESSNRLGSNALQSKPTDQATPNQTKPNLTSANLTSANLTTANLTTANLTTAEKFSFPQQLLVIDGTWRKARKIYYLNPWLADLPHVLLYTEHDSQYRIRKPEKDGQYSTLEATCLALAQLENNSKYSSIQQSFIDYMDHLTKYYPHAK